MLVTTKSFELGNAIYFECAYKTTMGVLIDPDNPDWELTNRQGTVIANGTSDGGPYKRSTGLWYIFWNSTDVGDYILEFTGEISSQNVKVRRPFKIVQTATIY